MTSYLPAAPRPGYNSLYIKVVPSPDGGFQAFLLKELGNGTMEDLLPIEKVPPMPTYREALDLAIVTAWQALDIYTEDGKQLVTALD